MLITLELLPPVSSTPPTGAFDSASESFDLKRPKSRRAFANESVASSNFPMRLSISPTRFRAIAASNRKSVLFSSANLSKNTCKDFSNSTSATDSTAPENEALPSSSLSIKAELKETPRDATLSVIVSNASNASSKLRSARISSSSAVCSAADFSFKPFATCEYAELSFSIESRCCWIHNANRIANVASNPKTTVAIEAMAGFLFAQRNE